MNSNSDLNFYIPPCTVIKLKTKNTIPSTLTKMCFVSDDDSASVHGIITKEGLFDGTISTQFESFFVEPISRYFRPNETRQTPYFHSILYKLTDVENPSLHVPCASQLLQANKHSRENVRHTYSKPRTKRWLLEGEAKQPFDDTSYWNSNKPKYPLNPPYGQPIDEVDIDLNNRSFIDTAGLIFGRNVNKRAVIDPKKTTCMLYLQCDHQFFQKYGTEEACIEVMTRHVQRVNAIYKATGK